MEMQIPVNKNRALISLGLECPFNCDYCYTKTDFKKFGAYKPKDIVEAIKKLDVHIVQFGYDTETLAFSEFFKVLDLMKKNNVLKHIAFATKIGYDPNIVKRLAEHSNYFRRKKKAFVAFISLADLKQRYEKAPSIKERIKLGKKIREVGIPCYINLRPLLPDVPFEEYKHILEIAKESFDGIVIGKLYYDEKIAQKINLNETNADKKGVMHWSLSKKQWNIFGEELQKKLLKECKKIRIKNCFSSSVDAINSEIEKVDFIMNKRKQYVISAYIVCNNKVLLIYSKRLKMWLPPGGHIEEKEIPEEALAREVIEEVGLELEENYCKEQDDFNTVALLKPDFIQVENIDVEHQHIDLVYYCKAKSNSVRVSAREVSKYKWFTEEELKKSLLIKRNVKLHALKALKKFKEPQ